MTVSFRWICSKHRIALPGLISTGDWTSRGALNLLHSCSRASSAEVRHPETWKSGWCFLNVCLGDTWDLTEKTWGCCISASRNWAIEVHPTGSIFFFQLGAVFEDVSRSCCLESCYFSPLSNLLTFGRCWNVKSIKRTYSLGNSSDTGCTRLEQENLVPWGFIIFLKVCNVG